MFDVLEMFRSDLRQMPLTDRRRVLEETLELVFAHAGGGRIAVSPTFDDGQELLAYVIERNLEGVIAKKRSGVYVEGARSWVKVKLRNAQEFVVLGWTPGNGALTGRVDGLLLGVRENGRWLYVGRAGSGPGDVERARLQELLKPLERDRHPEVDTGKAARAELMDVRWVEPALVVHVAFQRWSKDGRLVIPSLKGVRSDKAAVDVTREPDPHSTQALPVRAAQSHLRLRAICLPWAGSEPGKGGNSCGSCLFRGRGPESLAPFESLRRKERDGNPV